MVELGGLEVSPLSTQNHSVFFNKINNLRIRFADLQVLHHQRVTPKCDP